MATKKKARQKRAPSAKRVASKPIQPVLDDLTARVKDLEGRSFEQGRELDSLELRLDTQNLEADDAIEVLEERVRERENTIASLQRKLDARDVELAALRPSKAYWDGFKERTIETLRTVRDRAEDENLSIHDCMEEAVREVMKL